MGDRSEKSAAHKTAGEGQPKRHTGILRSHYAYDTHNEADARPQFKPRFSHRLPPTCA